MKPTVMRWSASILLAALALPVQAAAQTQEQTEVQAAAQRHPEWAQEVHRAANLYRVSPTLYRSARLRKDDVKRLQELGIKTVVSLRAFHSDAVVLKGSGIATVRVPINTWAISDLNVAAALKAVRRAEQDGPVLLHCLHGADRTGLVTAMYQVIYLGRSKQDALAELKSGGYGFHTVWRNIETYLRVVDVEAMRARLETSE